MTTIFDIEQKQDSPEKLLAIEGKETKFTLLADEFNSIKRSTIEAAINDAKLNFTWSNRKDHVRKNWNGIDSIQLLVMNFNAEWLLNNTDEVWLLIDRYKSKKAVRVDKEYKGAGFKHAVYPDKDYPERPSEILITGKNMVLDFGQAHYFVQDYEGRLKASGAASNNSHHEFCWTHLQFRIKVKKGNRTYFSKPKKALQMICGKNYAGKLGKYITTISYKIG